MERPKETEKHDVPEISILEQTLYEPQTMGSCSSSSRSSGMMTYTMCREKNYSFVAYPGPDVVMAGSRAEHLPLHFHVKGKQGRELRILTEDFSEYDGYPIPRELRVYFREETVAQFLRDNTKSVFETGKPKEQESK
jgi:hypothetical protein